MQTDQCKKDNINGRRYVRGYEIKFKRGANDSSCGGQCLQTGRHHLTLTVPITTNTCTGKAPRCPDIPGLDLAAFGRQTEDWFSKTFKNIKLDFTNEPSYETHVELRADAVNAEDANAAIPVLVSLYCTPAPGRTKRETIKPGEVKRVSPAHCNWPMAGAAMDLRVGDLDLMADGSDKPRRHFCITRYVPGRVLQGYRSDQKTKPCAAPDPVNRLSRQPSWTPPSVFDASAHQQLEQLAKRFAPRLYLHDRDPWEPSNINHFLQHSSMVDGVDANPKRPTDAKQLYGTGHFNADTIGAAPAKFLKPNAVGKKGSSPICYAYPRFSYDRRVLDITYLFFYGYSGDVALLNQNAPKLGNHDGDWERITVRLAPDASEIYGIYYAAHASKKGVWQTGQVNDPGKSWLGGPDALQPWASNVRSGYMLEQTHPLVFSALNTHASYNRPGQIPHTPFYDETQRGRRSIACWDALEVVVDPREASSCQGDAKQRPGCRCREDQGSTCGDQVFSDRGAVQQTLLKRSDWLRFPGYWGSSDKRDEPSKLGEPGSPKSPTYQSWWIAEQVDGPGQSYARPAAPPAPAATPTPTPRATPTPKPAPSPLRLPKPRTPRFN